ncbi:hypothetical protein [Streptomyces sp. NPDC053728]|uniref:hypothetical protein n=1 Tax=Streptomyces sp. NPDC053728 TaxID=3155534 RepID=UPI0034383162
MDIPDWLVWIALVLALLQALALVPGVRRLRGSDSRVRAKARLDLLDTVASLLLMGGLLLNLAVSDSWMWLSLAGLALMAAVYAVKGVRLIRARRSPTL